MKGKAPDKDTGENASTVSQSELIEPLGTDYVVEQAKTRRTKTKRTDKWTKNIPVRWV